MDVNKVTNAKPRVTGAIYRAPLGTTLPTDATAALGSAFNELGYISEEGITNDMSFSSDDVRAWGGDVVLTPKSETNDNFSWTLIESLNVEVLKTVYGDANVTGTLATGITVKKNALEQVASCWVIDQLLRDNALKRIVIPNGKLKELGEVTYNDSDPVGYNVTIAALTNEAGDSHYEYIQSAASTSGSGGH